MHILFYTKNKHRRKSISTAVAEVGMTLHHIAHQDAILTRIERTTDLYRLILIDHDSIESTAQEYCHMIRMSGYAQSIVLLTKGIDSQTESKLLLTFLDDVIRLPIKPHLLVARLIARARRSDLVKEDSYCIGGLVIDRLTMNVRCEDTIVPLSKTEFYIFAYLAEQSPHIVPRHRITEQAWETPESIAQNTIDVHIKNIRKKIKPYTTYAVETVRGLGYRYR